MISHQGSLAQTTFSYDIFLHAYSDEGNFESECTLL